MGCTRYFRTYSRTVLDIPYRKSPYSRFLVFMEALPVQRDECSSFVRFFLSKMLSLPFRWGFVYGGYQNNYDNFNDYDDIFNHNHFS